MMTCHSEERSDEESGVVLLDLPLPRFLTVFGMTLHQIRVDEALVVLG